MSAPFSALARPPIRLVVGAAAIVLVAVLAWWFGSSRSARPVGPQATAAVRPASTGFQLTPVQWASLRIEPINQVSFDSVLVADGVIATNDNRTAAVYSPFSGRVTAIQAQLGQTVRKGAPLATVLAAEAAQSDTDLAAAVAAETTTHKQFELAQLTERRQHELLLAEAGTQKDWLQSQSDLVAAENGYRAARAALAAVRAKAAILGGESSTRNGAVGLGRITAPIDGVVVQRQVAPGQFVNSVSAGGSTPLFTITDLRTVWVLASVSETDAAGLKLGQAVEVSTLALPERTFRARVSWVAAVVDPATHRVSVRAELANPDGALKPQMTATVRLFEGHPAEALAVARSAVVYEGQEAHCYVVVAERTLVARKLQIGRVQGGMAEVKSGLSAGDRVVTRGALFIDRAAEDETS